MYKGLSNSIESLSYNLLSCIMYQVRSRYRSSIWLTDFVMPINSVLLIQIRDSLSGISAGAAALVEETFSRNDPPKVKAFCFRGHRKQCHETGRS